MHYLSKKCGTPVSYIWLYFIAGHCGKVSCVFQCGVMDRINKDCCSGMQAGSLSSVSSFWPNIAIAVLQRIQGCLIFLHYLNEVGEKYFNVAISE